LTGTPNHPFWVDAMRDYVPLGKLEVGTVLHVQGGGEAILISKTWRQGDFEVFDFEVEGLHNFYVRGPGSDAAGVLVHNSTTSDAVKRRVKLRKNTRAKIETNQPRNADGQMIDPNTGDPLKPGEIDVGHKPGQEWRKRKEMHTEKGSTRKEVLDAENDPDLYQLEDRSSNRSHKHEQKD
jgi:hypothetical protein